MENYVVILLDFLIAFGLVGVLSFVVGYVIDRLPNECDLMYVNANRKAKQIEGWQRNMKWHNRIGQFSEDGVIPFLNGSEAPKCTAEKKAKMKFKIQGKFHLFVE